jgi:hypothetical protein
MEALRMSDDGMEQSKRCGRVVEKIGFIVSHVPDCFSDLLAVQ